MVTMKHVFKLTKEEQEIENSLDYKSIKPILVAERKRLQQIAKNTTARNKTITIRISERNLAHLKAAAAREGVPYQTFVTSLIQKHT
jgi:predicted DNA binding CopG/RHH family protein